MFLGYTSESKGYHLWCPSSKKVIQSQDVTFNVSTMFSPRKQSTVWSTSASDICDTNDKVELEVPTNGVHTTSSLPHASDEVHINEPEGSTSGLNKP